MFLSTWIANSATLLCAHAAASGLASGVILFGFPAIAERPLAPGAEAVGACFLFLAVALVGASVVLMAADVVVGLGLRVARRARFRADPDAIGHLIAVGAVAFGCALATPARAATFSYDFTFDGSVVAQEGGGVVTGTILNPGDDLSLSVRAIPGGALWIGGGNFTAPYAGFATGGGDSFAAVSVDLYQAGSVVFHSASSGWQTSGFVGATALNTGGSYNFDQMLVNYSHMQGDSLTLVASLQDILGGQPFFRMGEFAYQPPPLDVAATPLPGALVLFASALVGLGILQRRKRKTEEALAVA